MKIDTNITNKFFSRFDEARGIALHKKEILKKRKNKSLSYSQRKLMGFIVLFGFSFIFMALANFHWLFLKLSFAMYILANVYIIHALVTVVTIYNFRFRQDFKSEILLDKNGITDESYYGIKMIFKWDKVLGIVIGKYTVTIITDSPCYFYFDISKKDEVLKAINKYADKKLIIE